MPAVATAAVRFINELGRARTPAEVLNLLDPRLRSMGLGLRAYGAWRVPNPRTNFKTGYQLNRNMFLHTSVPMAFLTEFNKQVAVHGPTPLARKAWVSSEPFTYTECTRETKPSGANRWVFDLHARFGIRDGLYCPVMPWIVLFWSDKVLRLEPAHRAFLTMMANETAKAMNAMVRPPRAERRPQLTARELIVIQHIAGGHDDVWIAKELGLARATVRTFIARAQRRLKAKNRAHAVAEAFRLRLMQ